MKRLPVILVLLLMWLGAAADEVRTLGIQDGLGSRKIYQVDQDSTGFVWIYTQAGLYRYDGSGFRRYDVGEDISSRDNVKSATRLRHDADGRIWVALRDGKAYSYDRHLDRFEQVVDLNEALGRDVRLHDIMPFRDGTALAGTSGGFYLWQDGEAKLLGLEGERVEEIEEASDGSLWLLTHSGVYRALRCCTSMERLEGLPDAQYMDIYEAGNRLFLGTFSEGVIVYDLQTGSVSRLDYIPSVPVRVFCKSPEGDLLVGLDGAGVFRVDIGTLACVGHYTEREGQEGGLAGNTVSDICVGNDGSVWVSTTTNGLSRIPQQGSGASWLKHVHGEDQSLCNDHVNVIYRDRDGDFWYGTNKGVSWLHDGRWTHFLTGNEGNVVLAVAQDSRGRIWVGGFGMGLYRIDKATSAVAKVKDSPLQYVYHIFPEEDRLWLGGLEGDFCSYETATGKWSRFPAQCIGDIWPSASEDTLYVAGCQGLGVFDKLTGKFEWKYHFDGFRLRYPVRAIFRAADGSLWLATDGDGLVHYDPSDGTSERFTTEDGLLSDAIISVHEDLGRRIWFTTEEGLFWLDPQRRTIINADDLLGIMGGIFNPNSAWLHEDGSLSLGTSEGVLTFNPDRLDYFYDVDVQLMLTDLGIDYQTVVPGTEGPLLETSLEYVDALELASSSNSFSISFSTLNFGTDFRVRYEYALEGYDAHWFPAQASGTADYMQVRPGRYTFVLRAIDNWSGNVLDERRLPLRIRHPWYMSVWAVLIYIVMISAAIFTYVIGRRRRNYEKEMRRKMRTFVSVAHDLKTPVSLIKGPLGDLEKLSGMPEESLKYIDMASRNADKLMDMIAQLLELRKIEDPHVRLQLVPTDIRAWIESYVEGYRSAARYKGIELTVDVSSELPTVPVDREKLSRILENLLSNALKYTEKGAVDIVARPERDRWLLEVHDTGIGIPEREKARIFSDSFRASNVGDSEGGGIGLMITRQIVRSHEGTITFRSEEGRGTTFTVAFPFSYRHADILPAEDSRQDRNQDLGGADRLPSQSRSTLLLVDDEPDMLAYLSDMLSQDYDVLTAGNAAAALELARQYGPDLVITDVVMPVLSGEDLCRMLKTYVETVHIPVILLSAAGTRQNIIFGLEAGANDYITKPFDPPVLKARIRNLLLEQQRLRESVLAHDMSDTAPEPDWPSRVDKEFMDKVHEVLERELANYDFKIGDLCLEVGMSRTALYNKLKSLTGQGPNDFIRIFRLNRAKELLSQHRYTIAEVSDRVGFSDPKYFSVCFKKQFGESPSRI